MKLLLYAALLLWLPATVFSFAPFQHAGDPTPIRETIFYAKHGNPDWLNIREGVLISPEELLRLHAADMGLGAADELRVQRIDSDAMGFVHYRYQQYHQGVKVDGAEWLMHTQNGYVRTMNGKLVRGLRATVQTKLSAEEAIAKALAHIPAQRYMWEVASAEALLKRVDKDPNATFYPKPELVLVDPGFQRDPERFTLAWSMVVYAERPQTQKQVYVNAQDGKMLSELELLHDQNTPGQAQTKYSGVREIITDSIDVGLYRLVETTRGGGIETYNLYQTTDHGSALDFLDEDNVWNNVTPEKDEVATDAHWGAEMTFDYYFHKHNRSGIDGNNMPLISYVHYDYFWSNAQWTGKWAQFGDGDGNSWNPLTSLDVVGHEFTHGVTGNSAKLRYLNESGALNESFSDIFGTAIEFYADPEHADWLVGEDFVISGPPLRNMANPKQEDNPDTYKGEFWVSTTADNGGVHTNSGVQNYWFHLLSVGGSGTNDQSDSYTVAGIGLDSAAAIAYRNLNYYLVQLSDYADAREGSLQAAEDLYGICSTPVTETAKAWYAVGVGNALLDYDMRMIDIVSPQPKTCGLTNQQDVTVRFRYNGCAVSLQAGDKIPMAYQIDGNAIVWDTLTLSATLSGGDTLLFTFSEPSEVFATAGNYWLRCWTGLGTDMDQSNNALYTTVENIPDQNVDMRMEQVANLKSGCFLGVQSPSVEYSFYGCDSIPAGETITLFYRVNGGDPFSESIQLPYTLYRGGSLYHNFANFEDFSAKGPYV
ncbi:MAG: M4 family metallopeptidase, partial [Saprospiraceae bacterium]|nr:M4 family metallopeptidase [Saprospiraceae bacterium]